MNKLKLTPVSALFTSYLNESGKNAMLNRFINHLDFSDGDELIDEVHKTCDWYDEILLNKKNFIMNYIDEELSESKKEHLVIILAAGNYPFSLEILDRK